MGYNILVMVSKMSGYKNRLDINSSPIYPHLLDIWQCENISFYIPKPFLTLPEKSQILQKKDILSPNYSIPT